MRILLICDRMNDALGDALQSALDAEGFEVQREEVSREALKPCLGCFKCWTHTPGQCIITKDRENELSRAAMQSDAVALVSEIVYGGYSADIKAFLDRSIQNILPFFETYKGEMHHKVRYPVFPSWIAIGHGDVPEAERETFCSLAERNALNLRPKKHLTLTATGAPDVKRLAAQIKEMLEVPA